MVKFFDPRFAIALSEKVVIFYTIMLRNYQFFSLASKHLNFLKVSFYGHFLWDGCKR